MKTAIEWDSLRNKFGKKKSILSVFSKDMKQMLGEADFDLGKYANDPSKTKDQLPLRNCEDQDAYIEIIIKTKQLDEGTSGGKGKSKANASFSMPTIEEQENEVEIKEDYARREEEYKKKIKTLEETLEDLKMSVEH